MNIISQFNKFLNNFFNKFLENYFNSANFYSKSSSIDNYINFMTDLDKFNYFLITNIIKSYFEYIDECFFNSSYRRNFCYSKGFYSRTILTLFGEITFKRRYYYDNKFNDKFFFTDMFLNIPKRKYFDPFICAEICNESASNSYSKAGNIVANKIGNRINNSLYISRASARNIVLSFNIDNKPKYDNKIVKRLFVMLDEKFVGSQFNDNKDHMIKSSVIFEGSELEYKSKKKKDSMNRFKLVNPYTCASVNNTLLDDTIEYIYNTYSVERIEEIVFMGDCAPWIKQFPKSHWFNFTSETNVKFAMDGYHFSQALKQLTTNKNDDLYDTLYQYVLFNEKEEFTRLCDEFKELNPDRTEIIEDKKNYILNNWKERQLYQSRPDIKCSMESHISHNLADLFTSRPKAYSLKGIIQLLKLRLLKINKINIKEKYFNSLRPIITINEENNNYNYNSKRYNDALYKDFNCLKTDNYINFI